MRITTEEERKAHNNYVLLGGLKGIAVGFAVSVGIFAYARFKYPKKLASWTYSMKTAVAITPPAFGATVAGELASQGFSEKYDTPNVNMNEAVKEEQKEWSSMTQSQKIISSINSNKYKIITGLWAASLWGSWKYASRDKLMSKAQQFYDARMYAQFVTIILLLGSIGLSMMDENKSKAKNIENKADDDYMRQIMFQAEQAKQAQKEKENRKVQE